MGNLKRIHISKDMLTDLYVRKKQSMRQIAGFYQCSEDTIKRRLREYGIRRRERKVTISYDTVMAKYMEQGMSVRDIACHYNCSITTIRNRLRDLNITPRDTFLGVAKAWWKDRPREKGTKDSWSEQKILSSYESGNTVTFIAAQSQRSTRQIMHILTRHNVPIRGGQSRKELPLREIIYFYTVLKQSTAQIGAYYQVKGHTIATRLREAGYSIRGNRLSIDDEELYVTYREEGGSIARTARRLNCSYTWVHKRLQRVKDGKERK